MLKSLHAEPTAMVMHVSCIEGLLRTTDMVYQFVHGIVLIMRHARLF
jgi:hypothetical protein